MSAFAQPAVAQIRAWSLKTELVVLLPDLRAFSLFLCRDRGASDDLTQDTVVLALAKQHDFEPGTNLKAWLFTIMRSHFYSGLRSTRRRAMWMGVSDVEGEPGIDIADRSSGLIDLSKVLWRLSAAYREALMLVGACGFSYEEAATLCECSRGTMKARVSRARHQLAKALA